MNKVLYIIMNVIAILIALALIIFAAGSVKIFGLVGLGFILKEIISGDYKKHIN